MIFLDLFPCVKTWNCEQLLGGTLPHCLLPLHFLCFPTPTFFPGLKFSLAGVKQPMQSLNGYLNGGKCMNQNQRGTYTLYRAIFPSGSQMLSNGHPLGPRLKARDAGHTSQPGSSDIPANTTKSSPISKQEDNHIKRIGCVWLCAQSVASARRQTAPHRITQAEQQPSSPLGCAA